jgi:very-short-patch-repair endonuclease
MAYPNLMIAIEFDGYEHHGSRYRFDADRDRYTELSLAGWLVVHVTSKTGRAQVLDQVARALAARPAGYAVGRVA